MNSEGLTAAAVRSLDLRYSGQGYELTIASSNDFVSQFHRLHGQRYGYSDPKRRVDIVNVRVRMITATQHPEFERKIPRDGNGKNAIIKEKPIYYQNQRLQANIYDRSQLHPGDRFNGPAVVVEYSSTTFVPPASSAYVDEYSNLLIHC